MLETSTDLKTEESRPMLCCGRLGAQRDEYKEFFGREKQATVKKSEGWTKPSEGTLKINVDGSFSKETSSGGWGYVIRDHEGDVVVAAAGRLNHALDALQTEAEACIQALYKAQEMGISWWKLTRYCLSRRSRLRDMTSLLMVSCLGRSKLFPR